jgi:glutamyl-tRNA synthetase
MREAAQAENKGFKYDRRWRDKTAAEAPAGIAPSIRIKAPLEGSITTHDLVQGNVTTAAAELDDLVIMRSDGTPTYMLAVVVDDHDMGITHIIRGDDHLTNTARQQMIYDAMGWFIPTFAHIPLIHGADGAKLSKRHGALGAEQYREMGYLPEALNNYLLRLGWSHGDDEIISREQAIAWFDEKGMGKGASRFDLAKLDHLNGHYIKQADNARLAALVQPLIEKKLGISLSGDAKSLLEKALEGLKQRVKNLNELADNSAFYFASSITPDEKSAAILHEGGTDVLRAMLPTLEAAPEWTHDALFELLKEAGEKQGLKLGNVMAPFRAAITGSTASPSMFEVMELLGRAETFKRLNAALAMAGAPA